MLLCLLACSSPPLVYHDDETGMQVTLPPGFEQQYKLSDEVHFVHPAHPNLVFQVDRDWSNTRLPKEVKFGSDEFFESHLREGEELEISTPELYEIASESTEDDQEMVTRRLLIPGPQTAGGWDTYYEITMRVPREELALWAPRFREILESLQPPSESQSKTLK